ncbi:MAG: uroporphyrinogen decarboxylase family protein [Gemmatimonadota bacterium]|nr:uroporphyrinogen decarboxylase family protein [Gemmatimonadota bacterium]
MTPRERVLKALAHEQPDICPWHITFTIPAHEKLAAYLGTEDLERAAGNHFAKIEAVPDDGWQEMKPDFWRDEFGVLWDRTIDKDIGNVDPSALVIPEPTLEGLKFPDPTDPARFAHHEGLCRNNPDFFRVNDFGFTLFERAWTLRGMENLFYDMVEKPQFVHDLLDRILEWNLSIIEGVSRFDIDAILFGDDWGQQKGLIMGPDYWREFIKPRAAAEYKLCHERGMYVLIHSCGDVSEIMDDLVEIGVDMFNPFQPEVMDIAGIKARYSRRMAFFGGMSTQEVLPYETPEQVAGQTEWLIENIGKGGGYVFSPAHDIPGDVPAENMAAMIEVLKNQ